MVNTVVAHGVVEPYVCLTLYLSVNPLHVALVYHVYDTVARPHHIDVGVHDIAQRRKIYCVRPAAVVLCGADNHWLYVGVSGFKLLCNVVHQLGLLIAV